MKINASLLSLAIFLCLFFTPTSALGQCIEIFPDHTLTPGYLSNQVEGDLTDAEKKVRGEAPKEVFSHVYVFLNNPQRFRVKLDGAHVGDFTKTNDTIPFTVLENVYGHAKVPKQVWNKAYSKWETVVNEKRCVLIPAGAKIYGVVDHANSRYPFAIGGKGKLYVTISKFRLDGGTEIPLTFAEPENQVAGIGPEETVIRACRHYTQRKCIRGRRTKLQFPSALIGDTTSAGILLAQDTDNKISDAVGFFSIIGSISKATGVDGYMNPPNAALNADMVFEVMTENHPGDGKHPGAWIPLAPPAKPAKKKEEEKK